MRPLCATASLSSRRPRSSSSGDDCDRHGGRLVAHALARSASPESSLSNAGWAFCSRAYTPRADSESPAMQSSSRRTNAREKANAPTLAALDLSFVTHSGGGSQIRTAQGFAKLRQ